MSQKKKLEDKEVTWIQWIIISTLLGGLGIFLCWVAYEGSLFQYIKEGFEVVCQIVGAILGIVIILGVWQFGDKAYQEYIQRDCYITFSDHPDLTGSWEDVRITYEANGKMINIIGYRLTYEEPKFVNPFAEESKKGTRSKLEDWMTGEIEIQRVFCEITLPTESVTIVYGSKK